MQKVYVSQDTLYRMMYEAITRSARVVPGDVKARLQQGFEEEVSELAKAHLQTTLKSLALGEEKGGLACGDTGWALFYIKSGNNVEIEGGFSTLPETSKKAVSDATLDGKLRENMVHPLTRQYLGHNTGFYIPKVELIFDSQIDYLEVIAVTKGGGSEMYGSFYRMMDPIDGRPGIIKFILDSVREGTYAGKACGPNIVGVGIGGTADLCMSIAKKAALLRPVGDRHPEPDIARLENDLVQAIRDLNRGPMGSGGMTGVMDVHIEYAASHASVLPVGVQLECCVARRAIARYSGNGITFDDIPVWNYR
ncbi:fumarate hydratase [Chloroflexota bacterium]